MQRKTLVSWVGKQYICEILDIYFFVSKNNQIYLIFHIVFKIEMKNKKFKYILYKQITLH